MPTKRTPLPTTTTMTFHRRILSGISAHGRELRRRQRQREAWWTDSTQNGAPGAEEGAMAMAMAMARVGDAEESVVAPHLDFAKLRSPSSPSPGRHRSFIGPSLQLTALASARSATGLTNFRFRKRSSMEQNENQAQVDGEGKELRWTEELKDGGSLPYTDVSDSSTGWASIPGDFFTVRGPQYLTDRVKIPGGESLLQPLALDWLKSSSRIDNVLKLSNNRVMSALDQAVKAGAKDPFVWAFNLQVPSKEHYSAISYFVSYDKFEDGSVGERFLKGDDALKNTRLKLIANISEGPWIVKKAVGEQAICILGRSLTCRYLLGANFIEVDVDIGSSIVANAIVHLAIGYLTTLTVDLAFLLEAQTENELPEQILGTVRLKKMDLAAAVPVELLSKDASTSEGTSFQSRFWRGISTFMQPSVLGNSDDEAA